MSERITLESFTEWMGHPVTLKLFDVLKEERDDMKECLMTNQYSSDMQDNIKGRCLAIQLLLLLKYDDLFPNQEGIHERKH
jgi:hypothetical protein